MKFLKRFWLPALLAGAGLYFILKKKNGAADGGKPEALTDTVAGGTSTNSGFPLKKGSVGVAVQELQRLILSINPNALPKYGADGSFGTETANALKAITGKSTVDSKAELDKLAQQADSKVAAYKAAGLALMGQQGSLIPDTLWHIVATKPTTVYISDYSLLSGKSSNRKGYSFNSGAKLFTASEIRYTPTILRLSIGLNGIVTAVSNTGKKYEFIPIDVAWKKS